MALKWTKPPGQIADRIQRRAAILPAAIFDVGQNGSKRWEAAAKVGAPWVDRTSAARTGLTGEAQREGKNTIVYCYGTVEYQPYLELGTSRMSARPSIIPAFNQVGPGIVEDAATVVKRIMAGS